MEVPWHVPSETTRVLQSRRTCDALGGLIVTSDVVRYVSHLPAFMIIRSKREKQIEGTKYNEQRILIIRVHQAQLRHWAATPYPVLYITRGSVYPDSSEIPHLP